MRNLFHILALILFTFFLWSHSVSAAANNKYGIHLAQPNSEDIKAAADLVNSSGGRWGYITLVIQENDRNKDKWQNIFDDLRSRRLIPIIRLATQAEGDNWKRPKKEDVNDWVSFLDSLNWVVKERYIILFNKPNHAQEWGGAVDPAGYTEVAFIFAKRLKEKNKDFFVMLAGFDSAAPSQSPRFEDEEVFLEKMKEASISNSSVQQFNSLFKYMDGWASHSYPNHGYVGSPYDTGRNSVRNYEWELNLLRRLGVEKELPIFITETGWPHSAEASRGSPHNYYLPETVGNYLKIVFENIWLSDNKVRAVTPFLLNYQGEPFAPFSWTKPGGKEFYPHYFAVQGLKKEKGSPETEDKGKIGFDYPKELLVDSSYVFKLRLKNTGQGIWDKEDDYYLKMEDQPEDVSYFFSDLSDIRPNQEATVDLYLKTKSLKSYRTKIALYKGDQKKIETLDWVFKTLPLPSLELTVRLLPKLKTRGDDFEIQFFDEDNQMVYVKKGIKVRKGKVVFDRIPNVVLGQKYRVVVLKPNYLPRQGFIIFKKKKNKLSIKPMIPGDFNVNGRFDFGDFIEFLTNPKLTTYYFL